MDISFMNVDVAKDRELLREFMVAALSGDEAKTRQFATEHAETLARWIYFMDKSIYEFYFMSAIKQVEDWIDYWGYSYPWQEEAGWEKRHFPCEDKNSDV